MRLRIPVLFASAVLFTACLDSLPVPTGRYGAITAPTYARTGGGYAMKPQAAFYGRTDLTYLPYTSDTCFLAAYSDSTAFSAGLNFIDGGAFIQTAVSGRTDTLLPLQSINVRVYQYPIVSGIPFTPGDTLTILVPGATFPTGSVSVRTAEPFTHDSILVPVADATLPLAWTAAVAGGTRMNFSLRYNNGFQTVGLNEQIFCSFGDDGSATIPAALLDGWRTSLNDQRATQATRVRFREVEIDTRTRMVLLSTFTQPLLNPVAPTLR